MTIIQFWVPGRPVPKRRPRSGQGHFYTPTVTRQWEAQVASGALEAVAKQGVGVPLFMGPVAVRCVFYREGVFVQVQALEGKVPPGSDVDNLAKSVLDAIQGVVFANDRQVVSLEVSRKRPKGPHFEEIFRGWRAWPGPS